MRRFLFSRRANLTATSLLILGLVVATLGDKVIPVAGAHDGAGVPLYIPTVSIAPLLFAVIVALGLRSPFPEHESMSSRSIWRWEAAYALATSLFAAGIITFTAWPQPEPFTVWVALRNFLVLMVGAVVASVLVGALYGWLLPATATFLFLSVLGGVWWNPILSTDVSPLMLGSMMILLVITCTLCSWLNSSGRMRLAIGYSRASDPKRRRNIRA